MRNLILQLKFREMTEFKTLLGRMLETVFETGHWTDRVDYLVPVPLHWRRRLERGFNQSYLLAQCLRRSGIPICLDLVRIRYTRRQWDLPPAQRRRNVKGAFAVRKDHPFSGKTLCLVDDITTSGATLSECARTLKHAGAEKVYAIVLAVAEPVL
jgi:ComF family protein